ncbi:unnamed protein product [Calicophoron daubneyi]|uniref:Huntingtin n=1 Tax=Calicophoron daubneyi TaxID=300641 RepID=A0AAV2T9Q0_CALDB
MSRSALGVSRNQDVMQVLRMEHVGHFIRNRNSVLGYLQLCSNLRKAINQKSEHEIQKSIRNLLLHLKSVSSGEQSVWFAVQILLIAYIERFQKPLAQVLADPIFELASSKTNENFVFSRLLPAIVLIPGNRQSEFAQKLLQVASPSSRLCTLSNICSTNHRWPQEIYPVLRLLLNPMGSAHEENEEDQSCAWTSELYIAIVDAFSHQVQENPALTSSTQFANLLLFFLREHRSKLPPCTRPSLSQLAQQHTGFLRKPLCDLVAAICSS